MALSTIAIICLFVIPWRQPKTEPIVFVSSLEREAGRDDDRATSQTSVATRYPFGEARYVGDAHDLRKLDPCLSSNCRWRFCEA